LHSSLYDRARTVTQLHWGGGTPTFLGEAQMRRLMAVTREHFELCDNTRGEYGIELDPRELRSSTLAVLREIGFNRVSLGVQDFEPRVQRTINRVQSVELTSHVIEEARRRGFRSVSIDLIYGLPFQTPETIARTLDVVVALSPDRISIYNYAHLPERFPPQRRLSLPELPNAARKLDLLQLCIERLTDAGYRYIGMDHFAKPSDDLAKAQDAGRLYRNFQGYSTHSDCDLVGFGLSAIGTVHGSFYQNEKELPRYDAALDAGRLPIARGLEPDAEDRLRREVIMRLICAFELDYAVIERRFGIDFAAHFAAELASLAPMADDGLLEIGARGVVITPKGRFLIRNICMVFDRYAHVAGVRYSKTV
jgi:oxygen-independent coproporphyrinogen-3 oxidase